MQIQGGVGAGHLGICRLREVLLTPSHTALVLDYAAGGTVFDRLASHAPVAQQQEALCVPEPTARFMFKQLASTMAFLHSNHIAHRCVGFG
jgi:5'-AMP-activated protein kinase catalytic alpha subunit